MNIIKDFFVIVLSLALASAIVFLLLPLANFAIEKGVKFFVFGGVFLFIVFFVRYYAENLAAYNSRIAVAFPSQFTL